MSEITYKGINYVAADTPKAPADFMAPKPPENAVAKSQLPPLEAGDGPKLIVHTDGFTVRPDPEIYPPIGFIEEPDLEAARERNQSDLEILPEERIDVYKILHITTSKAMAYALAYWNVDVLLNYDRGLRNSLCRALIDMAQRYQREPDPTWVSMLEDPDFYDQWRHERTTAIMEDDGQHPDLPADGIPLPREPEVVAPAASTTLPSVLNPAL
jgi:hypothetical protein